MNKLDQLASELLPLILDHVRDKDLPACTLINKRFYKAATPLLWCELDIGSDKALHKVITVLSTSPSIPGQHVRSLHVANCETISDTHLLAIIENVPYLEMLHLAQACAFSDISLQQVPGYCPHLTSVTLHCQYIRDNEITNASMLALGQYCRQLTHLSLSNMVHLEYATLLDHFHSCPLTHLKIKPCRMNPAEVQPFVESVTLDAHHHHQHTLTSLEIGCAGGDAILTIINTHQLTWPKLTSFCLHACSDVTVTMATAFMQAHPQLRHLSLQSSRYLTDAYLDNVVRYLPNLLSIVVSGNPQLTASGICRLIKYYNGQLAYDVECDGCEIYPEDDDFPQDVDEYGYQLVYEDVENPEVIWFCANAFTSQ